MILKTADRVFEQTSSAGTGNITLLGRVRAHQSFSNGIGVGNKCRYCIVDQDDWEVGTGTLISENILQRDTVFASTNRNKPVNFSTRLKDIFVPNAAADIGLNFPFSEPVTHSRNQIGNILQLYDPEVNSYFALGDLIVTDNNGNIVIAEET